jgi:hypothetical protein
MFYLFDVAIILAFAFVLVLVSWWSEEPISWWKVEIQANLLERTSLSVACLLGILILIISFAFPAASGFPMHAGSVTALVVAACMSFLGRFNRQIKVIKQNICVAALGVLQLRGINLALALYLFFVCALTLFLALAPPNANDYDSLVYHLAAPARYLMDGRTSELPYDHHTYFPFAMEMLYALGLYWSGPVLAKLFHWLMLPLCCLAIMAIGQRHFSLRAGLIGAALFASIPIVLIEATTAYIDLGLTFFVLVAFGCFLNWLRTRETRWLLSSGLMSAFACNTKYFGVLFFGWLLLWALGEMTQRRKFEWKPLLGFCATTAVFGGFYYIRNWFWVGNPVYPFAYEIFGGKGWTAEMAAAYARDQASFGFGRAPLDWILLPFRAAWAPLNFGQPFWPLSDLPLQNSAVAGRFEVPGHILQTIIGPALLAFGVPLVFIKRKPQAVGFLLWSFLFFWVFWAATSQQLRYLIPSLGLLSVACGWGVLRLQQRSALLKWTIGIALCAWLAFVPALTAWRLRDAIPVALGQENPEVYLSRTFAGYDAMKWASENTPRDSYFAIYGEPRDFYLKRRYFWADDAHNNLIDYSQIQTGAQLVAALKKQGANYVLWNTRAEQNGGFGGPPPQIHEAIERGLLTEVYEARGYRVLRIN